jgi:hypothetical protein
MEEFGVTIQGVGVVALVLGLQYFTKKHLQVSKNPTVSGGSSLTSDLIYGERKGEGGYEKQLPITTNLAHKIGQKHPEARKNGLVDAKSDLLKL